MMSWYPGWGWGHALAMAAVMIAVWGIVAWGVVSALRGFSRPQREDDPRRILDRRFARGELTEEDYRKARELLSSPR